MHLDEVAFYPLDLVQALCAPGTWKAHSVDLVQHLLLDLVQICLRPRPAAQTWSKYARDLVQICLRPRPAAQTWSKYARDLVQICLRPRPATQPSSNYPAPVQQRTPRTKQKLTQTCGASRQCAKRPVLLVGATENAVWGTGFSTRTGRRNAPCVFRNFLLYLYVYID